MKLLIPSSNIKLNIYIENCCCAYGKIFQSKSETYWSDLLWRYMTASQILFVQTRIRCLSKYNNCCCFILMLEKLSSWRIYTSSQWIKIGIHNCVTFLTEYKNLFVFSQYWIFWSIFKISSTGPKWTSCGIVIYILTDLSAISGNN